MKGSKFAEYKMSENDIAEKLDRGLANIKEKYDRIKEHIPIILPSRWLKPEEKY